MEKTATRNRLSRPMQQMGMSFPSRERILETKTRAEVIALLGRLVLEAARRGIADEVRDDAP